MSKYVYNNSTGLFRDVFPGEDLSLLQDYEVACIAKPKPSCKCYGRGYIGRDPLRREYIMCRSCFRKITDFEHARARVEAMDKSKTDAKQKQAEATVAGFDPAAA